MRLDGVLFLASNTARAQAYAQALAARELTIATCLIFDKQGSMQEGKSENLKSHTQDLPDLFLPDLTIPVVQSCQVICEDVQLLPTTDINDPQILKAIAGIAPKLVIYAGYGGQILSPELLQQAPAFLHVHAGYLPAYRGSTTVYYSLLKENRCGVSAFLLRPDIDMGPIVARKHYPAPPAKLDIDYLYDSAIRADLLVSVLEHWHEHGGFEMISQQDTESGDTYYIIHPVLKHISILSLDSVESGIQDNCDQS